MTFKYCLNNSLVDIKVYIFINKIQFFSYLSKTYVVNIFLIGTLEKSMYGF